MTQLGVRDRCHYPGYSDDPMAGFHHLADDLSTFGSDFLGSGEQLVAAAKAEAQELVVRGRKLNAGWSGDCRARQNAREAFKKGDYRKTVDLLTTLRYPDDLSPSELMLLSMAQQRMKG